MAIKTYRPVTPTRRFTTTLVNDELTTNRPHKPLTEPKQRTGGRRNRVFAYDRYLVLLNEGLSPYDAD